VSRHRARVVSSQTRDAPTTSFQDAFFRGATLSPAAHQFTSPYTQHGTVYACVRVQYQTFAQAPFKLYRGETEVTAHKLLTLFQRPAPFITASELWQLTILFLELSGNCLWWLDNDGDRRTIPRNILVFNPNYFKQLLDRATGMPVGYIVQMGADRPPVTLSLDEVLHFRYPNPDNPFWGVGPLQVAQLAAQQDYNASVYNSAFFENTAEPGGLMLYKGKTQLTQAQRTLIKESWYETHGGINKAFKLGVLPGEDWDYKQLGLTHRDMQFLELRKYNKSELAQIFNVLPILLGEYEKTGLSDAGIKAQIRLFWDTNMIPKGRFLAETLNSDFIPRFDAGLEGIFDFDEVPACQQDLTEKLDQAQKFQALGYPINIINEVLDLGMPDVPWGDEAFVTSSLVPLSAVMDGATLPQLQPPPDQQQLPPDGQPQPKQLTDQTQQGKQPPPPTAKAPRVITHRAHDDARERRYAKFWRSYTEAVSHFEENYQGKIRRHFYKLRAETLHNLTEIAGARSLRREIEDQDIESILFAVDPARRELQTFSDPLFTQAYAVGGALVVAELGIDKEFLIDSNAARSFLEQKVIRVVGINETVREQLRASLLQGLDESDTLLQLVERVKRVMNSANSRSLTIARTEIGQAMSGGRYEAMREQQIDEQMWLSSRDTVVRESHAPKTGVDGEIRALGTPFSNGLLFPLDPHGTAEECVNCRCVGVPLMR